VPGSIPTISIVLWSLLQMELPDAGSDVGFLVTGVVSLIGILVVLALLVFVARQAWRPIAETVRFDSHEDD